MEEPRTESVDLIQVVKERKIVAIVRAGGVEEAVQIADAAVSGGISVIEIALNMPGALDAIRELKERDDTIVGAGTVVNSKLARDAVEAGAQFVVSPHTDRRVIDTAKELGVFASTGAATPTEVVTAWALGARLVKIFPASSFGGPAHIAALKGPLPFVDLIATGGVDIDNILDYFRAGASAVGVASGLIDRSAVESGKWNVITHKARALTAKLSLLGR
jgi:2-dehydro-3-deoxyphosphogluconate aldolase/(4S)-4-hydroxy-2-oxoglutarate aldolase